MADNDDRGRGEATRLNQKGRKRREPPLIEGSATGVSETPSTSVPAATEPEAPAKTSADDAPAETVSLSEKATDAPEEVQRNAEPVLFGQPPRGLLHEAEQPPVPEAVAAESRAGPETLSPPAEVEHEGVLPPAPASDPEPWARDTAPEAAGPSSAPAAPLARRGSSWSALSIVLGLLVLALLGAIAALLYTEPQRNGAAGLSASLEALGARVAALEARPDAAKVAAQSDTLDQRAQALEGEIATLKASVSGLATTLEGVSAKTEANEAALAAGSDHPQPSGGAQASTGTPANAGPAPASAADLTALSSKVEDLGARVAALPTPPAPAAPAPPVDLGPLEQRTAALDKRLDALTTAVAALPRVDLTPLQGSLKTLAARLAPLEAALSAPKAGDRVTEARAEGDAAQARAAPLAVVAQALIQAMDAGRPFATEVDALRGLGIDEATLRPLTGVAAKGAPSDDMLRTQWAGLENAVLAAIRPEGNASVLDRLAAGAKSLVQVRRVDAGPGTDAPSIVSRIDAALERGDLQAALSEWSKLPDAGRAASQSWADAARARIDAETAAQGLLSRALATLAQSRG